MGRFLEHSRIYYFAQRAASRRCSSAAPTSCRRNLDRRVEILFPVRDPAHRRRLRDEILATYLADTVKARRLLPTGEYVRVEPADGAEPLESQAWFLAQRVDDPSRETAARDETT